MRRCSIFLHEFKSVALRRHAGAGPAGVKQAGGIAKKKTEGSIPVRSAADQTAREIIASLAGVSKHRFENEEQRATVVTLMGALASDRKAALLEQSELAELTIIAFGLGMYLPMVVTLPMVVGGGLRDYWESRFLDVEVEKKGLSEKERTMKLLNTYMIATGCIVGEALLGTFLAIYYVLPLITG